MKKREQLLSLIEFCNDKQKNLLKKRYSPDDLHNRTYKEIVYRLSNRHVSIALKQVEKLIEENAKNFTL